MQIGRIFDILGAIVGVGLATVLVTSPNTASVISAFGSSFSSSIKAAMGR
jgi:hypothetical protein